MCIYITHTHTKSSDLDFNGHDLFAEITTTCARKSVSNEICAVKWRSDNGQAILHVDYPASLRDNFLRSYAISWKVVPKGTYSA